MTPTKEYTGRAHIRMFNADCMEFLKQVNEPYDLAIVDPPYGIGAGKMNLGYSQSQKIKKSSWDDNIPGPEYFDLLSLKSKNQIIWGMNYYNLKPTKSFIVWDKGPSMKGRSFAECELAYTSFDSPAKIFVQPVTHGVDKKIHKTQKPRRLYKWLMTTFAETGDRIIDTHGGSMSIAASAWDLGFDLDIIEIDTRIFNAAVKRFENHIRQGQLF